MSKKKKNKLHKIGQAYSINPEAIYPYKPRGYGQFGEGGKPTNKIKKKNQQTKNNYSFKNKTNIKTNLTAKNIYQPNKKKVIPT